MNKRRLPYYASLYLILGMCIVVRGNLVHRYSFTDGDTTAVDSVGGQDGTLENGAAISGNAVQLDGDDDYVDLPGGLIDWFDSVTFEAWFSHSDNGAWTRVFDFGDTNTSSGSGRDYIFFTPESWDSQARFVISDADPGFDNEDIARTSAISYNVPVYIACVYDGFANTMSLYVDGGLADSIPVYIGLWAVNNVHSYLGRSLYNPDPNLDGSIDEFRIYDSALTLEEIELNYLNGPDVIESPIVIEYAGGSTDIIEGETAYAYTVALSSAPQDNVTLTVDPDEQLEVHYYGQGEPYDIVFTTEDWGFEREVSVTSFDDDILEANPHPGIIRHYISSSDPNFDDKPLPTVNISIYDDECGAWGYNYADLNYDCIVNFKDFAIFASCWLSTFSPITLETLASDWLKTTQPYAPGAQPGPVQDSAEPLFIEPNEIVCEIDEKVYGHFLEHIYHSVNGGLWGELVWNRSMEQWTEGAGAWSIDGNELVQSSTATDVRLTFGNTGWTDYEYSLEAKKTGGNEGFLIIFRSDGDDEFYWLNLGGWNNTVHVLEKSLAGGSRGRVGPEVDDSIVTDHWYDIRIRCEGNRFRVWLDSNEIIDYTDNDSAHLSGQVGVGTWATTARFKNIRVEEYPGGTELFSGLPSVDNKGVPVYWTDYGTGSFALSSGALNSDFCLQIVNNDGTETGIEQTPFNVTTQQYSGSIWARGTAPGGMVVRLLDGPTLLGQAALPGPNSVWTEYSFDITPSMPAQDATLQVGVSGIGTAYLDQVSMMGQDSIDTGGYRPDLLQAIDDLRPPCIRWPGGCFASLYLWKDGIGPQHTRHKYPAYMWDDQDVSSYGTDEFLRMCEILGVEPIIVINTGRTDSACGGTAQFKLPDPCDYLPYALDWMEYCNGDANTTTWGAERAANGHPAPYNVKYWEIDNETWHMGISTYCDVVNEFAPALKLVDPNIIILACGSGGLGSQSWNQTLMNECADVIDYVSIHHYEGSSGYQSGPPAFEAFIEDLGDIIASSSNPDVRIYASEWNLQTTDWRTGLYAGGVLNGFERTSDVFEIGGPALFLRHQSASGWDNAFINFDHTGWFPAPNYVVMKLWHDNYAPYRINMTGDEGDLNAIATKSADGSKIYFKVVNPTDQEVAVKLVISDSFNAENAFLQLIAPDSLYARNTLENPDAVRAEGCYASLNGQIIRFTMPRLSAGVVQVNSEE